MRAARRQRTAAASSQTIAGDKQQQMDPMVWPQPNQTNAKHWRSFGWASGGKSSSNEQIVGRTDSISSSQPAATKRYN